MHWIKFDGTPETSPTEFTRAMVAGINAGEKWIAAGAWFDTINAFGSTETGNIDASIKRYHGVTHWAPMPKHPLDDPS